MKKEEIKAIFKKHNIPDLFKLLLPDGNKGSVWERVGNAFDEFLSIKKPEEVKEFEVRRLTNGYGHSHLVVITDEAVPDMHIGTVVIIPYAEGFKDPIKVELQIDEKGSIKTFRSKFGIVTNYIYE